MLCLEFWVYFIVKHFSLLNCHNTTKTRFFGKSELAIWISWGYNKYFQLVFIVAVISFMIVSQNLFTRFFLLLPLLIYEFQCHPLWTDFVLTQLLDNISYSFDMPTQLMICCCMLDKLVRLSLLMLLIIYKNWVINASFIINIFFISFRYTKLYCPSIPTILNQQFYCHKQLLNDNKCH